MCVWKPSARPLLTLNFLCLTWTPLRVLLADLRMFWILSQTLDPYERPWASASSRTLSGGASEERLSKPAKGSPAPPHVGVKAQLLCEPDVSLHVLTL